MTERFTDRTVIVTGSSDGIGRGIAERFAAEGASVVINSRAYDRAAATATEIAEAGGTVVAVEADVSDRNAVRRLVDETVEEFGSLDVMVNNAGVTAVEPAVEMTEEEWRRVIDVNLTGVFFGCQAAAQQMIQQNDGGQIINVSSIFGRVGVPGRAPYCASKAAVDNLTRCLAVEFAEHDIHVNALAPGPVRTSMAEDAGTDANVDAETDAEWPRYSYGPNDVERWTPLSRYGSIQEMGSCALFLASDDNYVTGETLVADGGWLAFGWGSKGT